VRFYSPVQTLPGDHPSSWLPGYSRAKTDRGVELATHPIYHRGWSKSRAMPLLSSRPSWNVLGRTYLLFFLLFILENWKLKIFPVTLPLRDTSDVCFTVCRRMQKYAARCQYTCTVELLKWGMIRKWEFSIYRGLIWY